MHIATNDLRHSEGKEIAQNIMKIKETIKEISPNTKTLISPIIQRFENKSLNDKEHYGALLILIVIGKLPPEICLLLNPILPGGVQHHP